MKKIPIALLVIIGGIVGLILGAANSWGMIELFSGIIILAGWIWFVILWDDLMKEITPVKHYSKRVRRIEREHGDYKAERAALDSSFRSKMDMLNKRHSQNVNGFCARNGQVIEFSNGKVIQKEETA